MPGRRARLASLFPALLLVAGAACGGSSDGGPAGLEEEGTQTALAVPSPSSATIARGGTTTVTVVFSTTGGLTVSQINITRQYSGISVTQASSQTVGTTITRVFTIGADNTVPIGAHDVRFSPSVSGNTGSLPPQITNAIFTLTVTQ